MINLKSPLDLKFDTEKYLRKVKELKEKEKS